MLFEKIGTGTTIEDALENAKEQLNAPEEIEIQYEVIQTPQKKTLGLFGGRPAQVRVYYELPDEEASLTYLKSIIEAMGVTNYTIEKTEEEKDVLYSIQCEDDYGILIGRRGETLDAIQYLVRLNANKGFDDADHLRISLNVGDYREKRAENLRALAAKNAKQVLKYGRNVALEPMNPYERRIIHTAIQEIEGVTSHSVGYDQDRKVIISLAEGVQPTHPSNGGYNRGGNRGNNGGKGGYNNRNGGKGGNRGGKGGYNNRQRDAQPQQQNRAPRKDSEGSLYGRIDVKKNEE